MAYEILDELLGSGDGSSGDNPQSVMIYLVRGDNPAADTAAGAVTAAYAAAPATVDGLPKLGVSVESLGAWVWRVTVDYKPSSTRIVPSPVAGEPNRESFSTAGATRNLKRSLLTVQSLGPIGDLPPHLGGLINVTEDAVEGVDVTIPYWQETVTRYLANSAVDSTFKATLFDLTGSVNNAAFRGFAGGEVLFQGATGDKRPADDVWEITYYFTAIPNQEDVTVGDIPPFDVNGHDYVWFRTKKEDDGASIYAVPRHGYVEQVYPYKAFSALGL